MEAERQRATLRQRSEEAQRRQQEQFGAPGVQPPETEKSKACLMEKEWS